MADTNDTLALSAQKLASIIITTKTQGVHEWKIGDYEGYMMDPGTCIAKMLTIPQEDPKARPKIQTLELIPWEEILFVRFTYEPEVPVDQVIN